MDRRWIHSVELEDDIYVAELAKASGGVIREALINDDDGLDPTPVVID